MLVVGAFVVFASPNLFAQATGAFNGRVVDEGGAVLPGATVTATNTRTGLSRSTVSNEEGLYSLPALDPGVYDVAIELPGFGLERREGVNLTAGSTLTLDSTLRIAALAETIIVSGSSPLVETTQSDIGGVLTSTEVRELPVLNRNVTGLVALVPGARPIVSPNSSKASTGAFSVGGGSGRNVNTLVDGGDNKDDIAGGLLQNYTVEGIEEFALETNRSSAVHGRASGGLLNIITKSGSNEFHGSAFGFDREDPFTAKTYFAAQTDQPKPPFTRHQYGGSLGGPVLRNRAFFFGAVERTTEDKALAIPDAAFDQLNLLVPLGAQPAREVSQPVHEHKVTLKLNFQLTDDTSAFVRGAYARTSADNDLYSSGTARPRDLTGANNSLTTGHSTVIGVTSILSATALNQFTFQNSGGGYDQIALSRLPVTSNLSFPSVQIGVPQSPDQFFKVHKLQLKNDLSLQFGAHAIRVGGDFVYAPKLGGELSLGSQGLLTFFDDPSVIASNSNGRYPQGFQTPGIVANYTQSNGFGRFFVEDAKQMSAYIQDDWRATSRLTLNLGLRYDVTQNFFNQPLLENSRTYLALKAIGSPYASSIPGTDWNNIAPRIGFAYDLGGEGRTVLRGGWGVYYDQVIISQIYQLITHTQPSIQATSSLVNTAIGVGQLATYRLGIDPAPTPLPATLPDFPNGARALGIWLDPSFRDPYSHQFNLGFAHQLSDSNALAIDYVRALGRDDYSLININPLVNGTRVLAPAFEAALGDANRFGAINIYENRGESRYDQLSFSLTGRAPRMTFQASYTLAWAFGYGGRVGSELAAAPQIADQPQGPGEWGPSPVDERHRVVLFGVFEMPYGIQVSPIFQTASARPYTLTAGADLNADGNNNDRYIDPSNGEQVAVNSERGDPLSLLDVRVTKSFGLGREGVRVGLFAEFFNLFNTVNFGNSYNGNGRSPLFKQPVGLIQAVGYPLQMQLGARLTF